MRPRDIASFMAVAGVVAFIQAYQRLAQWQVATPALSDNFGPPAFLKVPLIRDLPARLLGIGLWRVHVRV